jgi:hypothetical protein
VGQARFENALVSALFDHQIELPAAPHIHTGSLAAGRRCAAAEIERPIKRVPKSLALAARTDG